MAWFDRLREAAYTSPSGARFPFYYEDVGRSFDKKTTGFNFPDADGTFVQDLGASGRRYPLRVIFWGEDYDLIAAEFENALMEKGIGRLEHPIYGVVDVVPFGAVTRRDDLKTAANQGIIDITFWNSIGLIYPSSQKDPSGEVIQSVNEFNEAAAAQFEEKTNLVNASQRASLKNNHSALLNAAKQGLDSIADTQDNVKRQFDSIYDSINNSIDILVSQPLTLASQTILLCQSPARALTSILARLSAYKDLATNIINQVVGDDANLFYTNDLFASSYVTGQILSSVNNEFETKNEALGAAEEILTLFDSIVDWRDNYFEALEEIDTGESYQKLQESVAIAAGFLVEISFSLKQERKIILDRSRTIIDLVAELYGEIDSQLDFFINSNNLSGSEILELPKGREIVYYI